MPGPTTSDLIFSEQANHNFSKTLGELKRSTLSIHNRLNSILEDAKFAQEVAEAYGRPLIANERCGSWYIDPAQKGGSAYFKSTDGHTGVWKFSLRRLNLHLLQIIGKHDGCIIVDSTRRGKRMPDALSKTISIWCAVINRFLFPEHQEHHNLYTPPQVVSASEHAQMSALLPSFSQSLHDLGICSDTLRNQVNKPLRPFWITPENRIRRTSTVYNDFHPVICCTVSRRVTGAEASEAGYIQGAGDDTENWAFGLTAQLFWKHCKELLTTSESSLPELIARLVLQEASLSGAGTHLRLVHPTSTLFVAKIANLSDDVSRKSTVVVLSSQQKQTVELTDAHRLEVGLGASKIGAKRLRLYLPQIVDFVGQRLFPDSANVPKDTQELYPKDKRPSHNTIPHGDIIVACETGSHTSIGVALALVCLFYDDHGHIHPVKDKRKPTTKDFVRGRLAWFSTSMPDANPSRDVLQSVNSFLMDYRPSK